MFGIRPAVFVFIMALIILVPSAQQRIEGRLDIPSVLPPGALIYLESKDLAGQLQQWSASQAKQSWLQSENFSQFQKSRLYLRLQDRLQEFDAVAGLAVNLPLVNSLAGGRAGLALYSIQDLEFVFVTEISGPRFEEGLFFQQRSQYEQKTAEGGLYFSRRGAKASVSYAIRQNHFLLSTNENLLRATLHNLASPSSTDRLLLEPLFQETQRALARAGDVWMYLNMTLVRTSRYFRNEWLYGNIDEMAGYRAGVVRFSLESGQYREERQFLLSSEAVPPTPIRATFLQSIPGKLEWVQVKAATSREIATVLFSQLLNPLRSRDQTLSLTRSTAAYETAALLKNENRYFLQIDEPVSEARNSQEALRHEQEQLVTQLATAVENLKATTLLRCEMPTLDSQGFYHLQRALIFDGEEKNIGALKDVLRVQYSLLFLAGTPVNWAARSGSIQSLGSVGGLSLGTRANMLVLASNENLARQLLEESNFLALPSQRPLHYFTSLDLDRFRPGYNAMFRSLEYDAQPHDSGRSGAYFSQNLGSLLTSLSSLAGVSVEYWQVGNVLHEEVVYRIR